MTSKDSKVQVQPPKLGDKSNRPRPELLQRPNIKSTQPQLFITPQSSSSREPFRPIPGCTYCKTCHRDISSAPLQMCAACDGPKFD